MRNALLAAACVTVLANSVLADNNREAGQWIARAGIGVVAPDGDGLTLPGTPPTNIKPDDATSVTLTGVYMVTESIGVELLASYIWTHDIEANGVKIGETDQLPPTLSVQWHTPSIGNLQPYVGLGLNYTLFFNNNSVLGDLDLGNSFGLATQAGFDYDINDRWLVNFDARWIQIETEAKLDGAVLGDVEIDPYVVSVNVGYKF
jgi:outer membrane protein